MISRININDPEIIGFEHTMNGDPIPLYKDINKTIEYEKTYFGFDRNAVPLSVEEQIKLLGLD